jgi:acylphosphatase
VLLNLFLLGFHDNIKVLNAASFKRNDMQTVHVLIEGQVQGVFFRNYTEKKAVELGLNGWVKNMADGTVEAVFSGEEKDITAMTASLHTGSPNSKVEKVTVNDYLAFDDFSHFEIIY